MGLKKTYKDKQASCLKANVITKINKFCNAFYHVFKIVVYIHKLDMIRLFAVISKCNV